MRGFVATVVPAPIHTPSPIAPEGGQWWRRTVRIESFAVPSIRNLLVCSIREGGQEPRRARCLMGVR